MNDINAESINEGLLRKLASFLFPTIMKKWLGAVEMDKEFSKLDKEKIEQTIKDSNLPLASLHIASILGKEKVDTFQKMWTNTISYKGSKGISSAIDYWSSEDGANKILAMDIIGTNLAKAKSQIKNYQEQIKTLSATKNPGTKNTIMAYSTAIDDLDAYITKAIDYTGKIALSTKSVKESGGAPKYPKSIISYYEIAAKGDEVEPDTKEEINSKVQTVQKDLEIARKTAQEKNDAYRKASQKARQGGKENSGKIEALRNDAKAADDMVRYLTQSLKQLPVVKNESVESYLLEAEHYVDL